MTVRTVSNLPAAMHVETARLFSTFREVQPPVLEWRRLERPTRFDRGGASTC